MESALAQAVAEGTPLVGLSVPDAATPQPEAQIADGQQQPETTAPEPEYLELPDPDNPGQVYTRVPKDPVAMAQWVIDRNRSFSKLDSEKARLEAENNLLRQMGQPHNAPPAPAPALPGAQASQDPEITARANEFYAEYSRQFDGDPEQIWAAAMRDAKLEVGAERRAIKTIERREALARNEQIVRDNPVLSSDFGKSVFEKYGGQMTAEMHLALVEHEARKTGADLSVYGLKPTLSPATKATVQNSIAARTSALSTPTVQAAQASTPKAPSPELLESYRQVTASQNLSEDERAKLWAFMERRDNERKGAA